MSAGEPRRFRLSSRAIVRLGFLTASLVALVLLLQSPVRERFEPELLAQSLLEVRETVQATWYAPLLFIAAFALGGMVFLPATAFTLSAALFWGWKLGGTYAVIGALLCSAFSFELSRYVLGDVASRILRKRIPRLHRLLDHAGARTVLILRLVPGIPFPAFNYGAGLTSLRSRDYLLGSLLGIAVPIYVISYSADAIFAGTLNRADVAGRLVIAALLMGSLVTVSTLLMRRVRLEERGVIRPGETIVLDGESGSLRGGGRGVVAVEEAGEIAKSQGSV
jgi:uncharacterized membrane protein YdjX (TVP38/TMEM64 family)